MATGVLAQAALSATTYTTVFTAATATALNINILNRGTGVASVRIAIGTISNPSSPANSNFIEYNSQIPPSGVLERTGLLLNAGQVAVCYASTADTSVSVYGIET